MEGKRERKQYSVRMGKRSKLKEGRIRERGEIKKVRIEKFHTFSSLMTSFPPSLILFLKSTSELEVLFIKLLILRENGEHWFCRGKSQFAKTFYSVPQTLLRACLFIRLSYPQLFNLVSNSGPKSSFTWKRKYVRYDSSLGTRKTWRKSFHVTHLLDPILEFVKSLELCSHWVSFKILFSNRLQPLSRITLLVMTSWTTRLSSTKRKRSLFHSRFRPHQSPPFWCWRMLLNEITAKMRALAIRTRLKLIVCKVWRNSKHSRGRTPTIVSNQRTRRSSSVIFKKPSLNFVINLRA